ncbi:MAG: tRNA pseudouridine(13) synthase TruD [Rudaea sp.]
MNLPGSDLPYAHGGAPLRGTLRATHEDFYVDEELGFAADGAGEHVLLRVEKAGANTDWVAREIAKFAGVDAGAVSYAGMKDRHAVTRQTFSVHLPGKREEPEWPSLAHAEFRVLEARRHSRKLQRGALKSNFFRLVVRNMSGDRDEAERVLAAIAAEGVPNYFGEQRFGREGGNVARARAMFAGRRVQRHERSLLLSAARSQLFNAVLAQRVERDDWNRPLAGDVWMLDGTQSIFGPEPLTDEIEARLDSGDISPTGPLWGSGLPRSADAAAEIELAAATAHADLAQGLVQADLRQERRALVLRPGELSHAWLSSADLQLEFRLRSGSYATVVVREILINAP